MSSSTTTSSVASRTLVECRCGVRAKVCTSWTHINPGRRFYGCPYYQPNRNAGCGFFEWYDAEICPRGKLIIKGLLRRIEKHQDKEKMFWSALGFSWMLIVVCLLVMVYVLKNFNGEGVRDKLCLA